MKNNTNQIMKLDLPIWIKYWLAKHKNISYILSEILTGTEFFLEDSAPKKFKMFDIIGRTTQESTTGKQLFDKSTIANGAIYRSNGNIDSDTLSTHQHSDYIEIEESTQYYATIKTFPSSNYGFAFYDNSKAFISSIASANLITTPATAKYVRICWAKTGTYANDINTTQLEKGSTATSYEPFTGGEPAPNPKYPFPIKNTGDNGSVNEKVSNSDGTQEQNISFPLSQGQKLMEGSHPDDDEKIHHKWGEMVLPAINSLTSGTVFGVSCKFGAINIPTMKSQSSVSGNFFCDKVKYANGVWGKYQGYVIAKNFVVLTDLEDTVENFNSKISGATLQFPLEEEQTEDFTSAQQTAWKEWKKARTYKNITHISSEDETPAELKIQYYKEG